MSVHDTKNPDTRDAALEAATAAVRDGKLIVLPTDTVYGIGADAFTADAVADLLEAKGRGRDTPPPVLVGDPAVLHALAVDVPDYVEDLTDAFWPGALTLILNAQPSLTWDLGETRGTVALRMPDDEIALDLLRRTGPLAVSSANRHGKAAALTVLDAATQLGDSVEEYLDGGTARIGTSSTIIDTTVEPPEIVREGAISKDEIIAAVGDIFAAPEPPRAEDPEPETAEAGAETGSDEPSTATGTPDGDAGGDLSISDEQTGSHEPSGDVGRDAQTPAGSADAGTSSTTRDEEASDPSAPLPAGVLNLPSEPDLHELSAEQSRDGAEHASSAGTREAEGGAGPEHTPG